MNQMQMGLGTATSGGRRPATPAAQPPVGQFLTACVAAHAGNNDGAVANYIPELSKANPAHFGVALATTDGHVYEAGDSQVQFTIQSISKAFVFALALEKLGHERVEATIGVEPSGEPFNSIHLNNANQPFNAMVNAGAIACSGLIHQIAGDLAFERILEAMSSFAGRSLDVDESVFESERATGDRNRAIAFLLRNYDVVRGDVHAVLDVYFRQCSILVNARDLAVMAATLANRGINPITEEQVVSPYAVSRTLSVMTSSGMYDYAGEWVYRVGIPAKSGVGGGIVAALPSQFGLGTFSPLLDSHGNSVRGLKVCEEFSSHFDLHVLNRNNDVRTSVIADYDIRGMTSRRNRLPNEQQILDERHQEIRVIELIGALSFASVDYITRQLTKQNPRPQFQIVDLRRVPTMTQGAGMLLAKSLAMLTNAGTTVILSGLEKSSDEWAALGPLVADISKLRVFELLDEAIEWAEDQIIYLYGGFDNVTVSTALAEHALLAGLSETEVNELASVATPRRFQSGQRIITCGEPATSMFFLQGGMVSVKLPSGVRLATLTQGMVFGEMALIEGPRHADVWADTAVTCLELPLEEFHKFRDRSPATGERIALNLAAILARRLIASNNKIDMLTGY